jgi:hypothetical protein
MRATKNYAQLPSTAEADLLRHLSTGASTNAGFRSLFRLGTSYHQGLNRPLQTLRKRGVIVTQGGEWHAATQQPCPTCGGSGVKPR